MHEFDMATHEGFLFELFVTARPRAGEGAALLGGLMRLDVPVKVKSPHEFRANGTLHLRMGGDRFRLGHNFRCETEFAGGFFFRFALMRPDMIWHVDGGAGTAANFAGHFGMSCEGTGSFNTFSTLSGARGRWVDRFLPWDPDTWGSLKS